MKITDSTSGFAMSPASRHRLGLHMRRAALSLLLFTSPAMFIACGGAQSAEEELIVEQGPDDKIYEYKTVSRQLRAHPLAGGVARELDLVDVWLTRAERMIADEEDEELLELQLQAIEGQLVEARSHLSRREAEKRLEDSRSSYESRMKKIQSQRDRNASQLERSDAEVNR